MLTSLGGYDLYVMKLNSTGNVQWAMSVGGAGTEAPKGIIAANATVAFIGSEQNGITIGSTVTPDYGALVGYAVGLDASTGTIKWSHVLVASGGSAIASSIFSGTSILVGGTVGGTLDFGSGNSAPIGGGDAFIAHYDPDTGNLGSLERWGASGSSASISEVSQDSASHSVVLGGYTGSLTLGSQTYTSPGPFVANFNGATNVWLSGWATSSNALFGPTGISVGTNDIATAGNFCNGTLYVNATTLSGAACTVQNPSRTGFVIRLKDNGSTYLSIHSLGPIGWVDAVSRTGDDRLFITGKFKSSLAMDTGPVLLQAPDGQAAYVMAFAP
jgi:hypothetical protein